MPVEGIYISIFSSIVISLIILGSNNKSIVGCAILFSVLLATPVNVFGGANKGMLFTVDIAIIFILIRMIKQNEINFILQYPEERWLWSMAASIFFSTSLVGLIIPEASVDIPDLAFALFRLTLFAFSFTIGLSLQLNRKDYIRFVTWGCILFIFFWYCSNSRKNWIQSISFLCYGMGPWF